MKSGRFLPLFRAAAPRRAARFVPTVLAALFALVFLPRAALPDGLTPATSPQMDTGLWGTDGSVNAIVRSGHTVYIGGAFSSVAPSTGGGVPLNAANGRVRQGFPKVNGQVYTAIADKHGGWFIGGAFTAVGGLPRQCLAHVLSDGSVSPWQVEADPFVFALALKGDTLFVGGRFRYLAGVSRVCLGAVHARTGAVLAWAPDPSGDVRALELHGNTLYVGGGFGGISAQRRTFLAALDVTTGLATSWDPEPRDWVLSLAANDSTVYAAGSFTVVGGQNRNWLAAIDARSGAPRPWDPSPNDGVLSLTLSGRMLFALGSFSSIGGQPRNGAAALDAVTGGVLPWVADSALGRINVLAARGRRLYAGWTRASSGQSGLATLDPETGAARGWRTSSNGVVSTIALAGDVLYAGGGFSSIGPGTPRSNLAALDVRTGKVTPWNPNPDGASIEALAVDDRTVYVGGDFTRIGGRSRSNFAAVDIPEGRATGPDLSANGAVQVLERRGHTLYAGGGFSRLGGQDRNNLAAVDLSNGAVAAWNPGTNGRVMALAADEHSVYVGGEFDMIGGGTGVQPRRNLAAVDATTGDVTAWDPDGNAYVSALALSGNTLYAGGHFSRMGGQVRDAIAAVDATTGGVLPWTPGAQWLGAHAVPKHGLAVEDSTVYVGGRFAWIGGAARTGFAALDANTAMATDWDPGRCFTVTVIAAHGNTVYAGGHFGQMGGYPANNFAAFSNARIEAEHQSVTEPAVSRASGIAFGLPNPVRGNGVLRFSLPAAAAVSLGVFDLQGRLVESTLDNAWLSAGEHAIPIHAELWHPGLYLCRITTGDATTTRKLFVVR